MRKFALALIAAALPAAALAQQSAIDALQVTQPDFKGTARFMAMGGAFTALGGDLSTLSQNPGGIGVYRSSDFGVTLDINFQSNKTSPISGAGYTKSSSQTKAYCNNVGYIGATNLSGPLKTFNWGVSYGRIASFDRVYSGYMNPAPSSLSNYIAYASNGVAAGDMGFRSGYNPYQDSNAPWLSILGYTSYLINPTGDKSYMGLRQNGTIGDAQFDVVEKGYVDEYNIALGGNIENIVYWGIDFGIIDINYTRYTTYSESMEGAVVPTFAKDPEDPRNTIVTGYANGNAGFTLDNRKYISGSGWNMKIGLIIRPVNELRFGVAVHTPTWYKLDQGHDGNISYSYFNTGAPESDTNPYGGYEETDEATFPWRLHAPWKIMVGAAGVIGSKAIISVDYEYDAYDSMKAKNPVYDNWGYAYDFGDDDYFNTDVKNYCKGSSVIRVGAEYRVTPQFSLRAGYNVRSTSMKSEASDGNIEIYTSGTDPSYSFDKTISYITAGLGYRYKGWYIDMTYAYQNRDSRYHAFTNYDGTPAPQMKLTDHNSSLVISTGFRF